MDSRPAGAPFCWGRQFDENDKECSRCEYKMSCKSSFFRSNSVPNSLPMYQPQTYQPPPTYWGQHHTAPVNPLVPQTQYRPVVAQPQPPPVFSGASFPPPPPTMAAQPAIYQAPNVIPIHHIPPNQVQGIYQQSPHYNQYYSPYPGESVGERVIKHIFLRLGQVFFHELSNFFGLWKWPPGVGGPPQSK